MSVHRQKKQLTTLENVSVLSDPELREALKKYNISPGPITDSTRNIYLKKLASLIDEKPENFNNISVSSYQPPSLTPPKKEKVSLLDVLNDKPIEDSTDESYDVNDEEEESSDYTDDDDDDDEGQPTDEENIELDGELDGELDEDIRLTSSTAESSDILGTSNRRQATSNRKSRSILIFLLSLIVALVSFYIFSSDNYKTLVSKRLPYIAKLLLVVLVLVVPVVFVVYKTIRFYILRRNQENQRVCDLVNQALELLQSPDNPQGLMPILHIRDTLLTPAERKTKKMINLWTKTAKFIEEHESRVKVEMVNIDGEAFRAWKWIGTKKL